MPTRSPRLLPLAASLLLVAACSDAPSAPTAITPGEGLSLSQAAPQPSVAKFEIDYMQFTIDHHLAGVVMAELCIERAVHEDLRALCEESLANQTRQIELLRAWLLDWYGIAYPGEIPQSAEQDIRRLSELSGAEFEDEFLTEFSKHHLRIIKESEKAVQRVYHAELRAMIAQPIIMTQSRGVAMMQTWDCQWYGDCRQGLINQVREHL